MPVTRDDLNKSDKYKRDVILKKRSSSNEQSVVNYQGNSNTSKSKRSKQSGVPGASR